MTAFLVFKVRTSCTECGEGMVLEGPRLETRCQACASVLTVPAEHWTSIFGLRGDVDAFGLTEGKTRGSSLTCGELRLLVSWGPQRPLCRHCGAALDLALAPPGADHDVPSPPSPTGGARLSLFSFACPDCGVNLKVGPDSPRVLRCGYCQGDSFLPDALWHAMHPVKKRTPFYVAFRS